MLEKGAPYPQVILPQFGGYWIEEAPPPSAPPPTSPKSSGEEVQEEGGGGGEEESTAPGDYGYQLEEMNEAARAYRKHFLGRVRMEIHSYKHSYDILHKTQTLETKDLVKFGTLGSFKSRIKSHLCRAAFERCHNIILCYT